MFRAVLTFVSLYLTGCFAAVIIGSISFVNCLTPDEWGRKSKVAIFVIVLVHLFNLQLAAFGYVPQVHKYFRVQNMW